MSCWFTKSKEFNLNGSRRASLLGSNEGGLRCELAGIGVEELRRPWEVNSPSLVSLAARQLTFGPRSTPVAREPLAAAWRRAAQERRTEAKWRSAGRPPFVGDRAAFPPSASRIAGCLPHQRIPGF